MIRIDSTTSIDLPKNRAWKTRNIFPFLIKRYYKYSDEIVSVSDGVAKDLYDNFGIKCTRRIYNGIISEDLFRQAEEPIHEKFFPQDSKIILSVGRLAEPKNQKLLIEAFSRIPHKGYKLVILGEGGERDALTAQVKRLGLTGKVIMPGFVSNPYKFMARSSLFVLSSDWEGLGNVLIEALALGLPVVSTDCPNGPREILKDCKFGHLVPTKDPEALASAMLKSLKGDKRLPASNDLKEFTIKESTKQYMELFNI
jgi:glycosyltransferase involved in cell wall biosynthesis